MSEHPPKPAKMPVNPDGIPAAMKAKKRWLVWAWEWKNEKWDKPPRHGGTAKKTDDWNSDENLVTFDVAFKTYSINRAINGIGYQIGENELGVDLDSCITAAGAMAEEARKIIEALDTFTDFSPSGTGAKLIIQGDLDLGMDENGVKKKASFPAPWCPSADGKVAKIELFRYGGGYFTITGHRVPNTPDGLASRQAEAEALLASLQDLKAKEEAVKRGKTEADKKAATNGHHQRRSSFRAATGRARPPSELTDDELLKRLFDASNGAAIRALYDGDTSKHPSRSEAEMALLSHLRWWTGGDNERAKRMFRASGFATRAKSVSEYYLNKTLSKMGNDPVWQPQHDAGGNSAADGGAAAADPKGQEKAAGESPDEIPLDADPTRLITLCADMRAVNDQAIALLAAHCGDIYQQNQALVRCVRAVKIPGLKIPDDAPMVSLIEDSNLRELMADVAFWRKHDRRARRYFRALPPTWSVNAVRDRKEWDGIRYLVGVTASPMLRPDGTVIQVPGYDNATGWLYIPNIEYPAIPERPSFDVVNAAVNELFDVVNEFPFASDPHKAAWLACTLTPMARPAFDGPSPLFQFDSPAASSGKTLLSETSGVISLGYEPAVTELSDSDEEMRKAISAILLAGVRMVRFDNASGVFGSPALDAALTTTRYQGRILGETKLTPTLLNYATWTATGNNLDLRGDLHRRVIPCRIVPLEERPEERGGWKYPNLLEHVKENRARLAVAGLTILRGFFVAGKPQRDLPAFGKYEGWGGVVRQAVVWATGIDAWETRHGIVSENRGGAGTLAAVLNGWRALPGGGRKPGLSAACGLELIREHLAKPSPKGRLSIDLVRQMAEALAAWAKAPDPLPCAKALGKKFSASKDRVVGGLQLQLNDETTPNGWWVKRADGHEV